ncbi:MAG: hypothetical protein LBR37_03160 [Erysipelotrichaceae bacterium]|nr:hypothetical protein [Erysipelotrichaceae bacterium]
MNITESYTYDTTTKKNNKGEFFTKDTWVELFKQTEFLAAKDFELLRFWMSLPNATSISARWAPEIPFVAIHNMFSRLADKIFAHLGYRNVMYTTSGLGWNMIPHKFTMFLLAKIDKGTEVINGKKVAGFIFELRPEIIAALTELGYSLMTEQETAGFIKQKQKDDEKTFKKIAKDEAKEDEEDDDEEDQEDVKEEVSKTVVIDTEITKTTTTVTTTIDTTEVITSSEDNEATTVVIETVTETIVTSDNEAVTDAESAARAEIKEN